MERRLLIDLGEARGNYMAARRCEAFKAKFGREPDFNANFNEKNGFPEDFLQARLLLDVQVEYEAFYKAVVESLSRF